VATPDGYEFLEALWNVAKFASDESAKRAVAPLREIVKIMALPDAAARGAAMVALMASNDPYLVYAAGRFQSEELDTPEKSRPHVAGLVAALRAPLADGRTAAMRALRGLTPPEAFDRLVELSRAEDEDGCVGGESKQACAALDAYDREDAVKAVLAAADRRGGFRVLVDLGASRRPEAHERLRALMLGTESFERELAFKAYTLRFRTYGVQERNADDLIAALRHGVSDEDVWHIQEPLIEARSLRVAKALVEVARDDKSTRQQRNVAYAMLQDFAGRERMDNVAALLRTESALFVTSLGVDGGGELEYLCWLLHIIHTPEARARLELTSKSHPDETVRKWAESVLGRWDVK